MAVQARLIAVSTHSSNVKPRFRETTDFATATLGQKMAHDDEAGVEPSLLLHWHSYRPYASDEEQA
jgi:hypothetical protein